MDAAFKLQAGEGVRTGEHQKRFVGTAQVRIAEGENFGRKTIAVRVFLVHAQQIPGKKSGFLAADTGPDFQNHIPGIHRIRRNQHNFQLFRQICLLFRKLIDFRFGLGGEVRIRQQLFGF